MSKYCENNILENNFEQLKKIIYKNDLKLKNSFQET